MEIVGTPPSEPKRGLPTIRHKGLDKSIMVAIFRPEMDTTEYDNSYQEYLDYLYWSERQQDTHK